MTALPAEVAADLERRVAELEQKLQAALAERDDSVAREAAIWAETARLYSELRIARDRQNATADILRTIASVSGDAQTSLQQIAETTARLFGAPSVSIMLAQNGEWTDTFRFGASAELVRSTIPLAATRVGGRNLPGTVVAENRQVHIPDVDDLDPAIADWPGPPLARAAGTRTMCGTPLRREGKAIGVLVVYRDRRAPFTDEELALQQSFADQAAIATENSRLFNETREALERQTATAEILKVIASSPSDVQPVFDAIVTSATRLIGGFSAGVYRFVDDLVHLAAFTSINPAGDEMLRASFPRPIADIQTFERVRAGEVVRITDTEAQPAQRLKDLGRARGFRSVLNVPLISHGTSIGMIVVSRTNPGPFAAHHVELLQAFADQAVIAIENVRLFNETREALEQQTATSDILKVIASSPSDVQPVFDAILDRALHLCEAAFGFLTIHEGERFEFAAQRSVPTELAQHFSAGMDQPLPGDAHWRLLAGEDLIHNLDQKDEDAYRAGNPLRRAVVDLGGARSALVVALRQSGALRGAITIYRKEVKPFSQPQIALLRHFADQAVIAIENVRLFNETREALERQTATAEVLKVIASSPSDVQPVFAAIADSAKRLLGAFSTTVLRFIGDELHLVAYTPTDPAADEALRTSFPRKLAEFPTFALVRNGETIQFADTEAEEVPAENRELARLRGFRSVLFTPLMNQGAPVGMISVTRADPGAFSPHHIQLLQTFADQAVIAIENTRLFNETREALERQTATADILNVIASSPSDVQPVFEAIVESAKRLLGGFSAAVFRFIDGIAYLQAITPTNPAADEIMKNSFPRPVADFQSFTMVQGGSIVQTPDTEALSNDIRDIARARGFRSMLITPLMSGGTPIGMISVTRVQTGTFHAHHEQLLQTFADQAVIAIENTRLFNETQEALERQTATADILKVIASSPSDVQPVFDAIAHSAKRLIGGFSTAVHRVIDDIDHLVAFTPTNPESDEVLKAAFPRHRNEMPAIISLVENGETAQIADSEAADEKIRKLALARGWRSASYTPLMNQGTFIGFIVCTRRETGMLGDHHVQLLRTFADQAVIAIENTRLFNETKEALERQTATAEILKVIASSPSDVQPVFDAIAHSANRLIGGFSAAVFRYVDGKIHLAAFTPTDAEGDAVLQSSFPAPLAEFPPYQLTREGAPAELPDTDLEPAARDIARARGYRSMLFAPLMNDGEAVGIITVTRVAPGPFGEQHARLLQMFADQAVIAIKNVGLFNEVQARTEELSEALQQQTATADVLKVISRSAFDLETVLDALLSSACRLCEADIGTIRYREGGEFRVAATFGCPPEWIEHFRKYSTRPDRSSVFGRTIIEGQIVHIPDLLADPDYNRPEAQKLIGFRAALGVPLTREGEAFGVINLFRFRVSSFEAKQIELVQTFADQAVIAIENVRLFDEVQAKTRDLTEALTYQTGSGNILSAIASSPTDVAPVLKAIVESACELCEAYDAVVLLKDGDDLRFSAHHGPIPISFAKWPISRRWTAGRAFVDKKAVHVHDLQAEPDEFPDGQELSKQMGHRSILSVPLLREGESIGVIVLRRTEVRPFTDKQAALLQTFADQAVIAIGNVRLFEEVQAKTRDLTESLQQQTATADVLKVISRSAFDLPAVLQTLVESAAWLCDADKTNITRERNGAFYRAEAYGFSPEFQEYVKDKPIEAGRGSSFGRALLEGRVVHIPDVLADPEYTYLEGQRLGGYRTVLTVPMLREHVPIGVLSLTRSEVRPFTDKQVELATTFADQAVIAIENVRLFDEVQAKTRDLTEALTYQTGSANILKVIASSPTDIKPVLNAIVESANELCGAYDAVLRLKKGDELELGAHHGTVPADWNLSQINPYWTAGRAALEQRPVHVHDMSSSEGDEFPDAQARARDQGHRTILSVPLLQEGNSIGTITLRRLEVSPFSDKQIALLQTFADQAVIAIGNVRLFEEVQQRTRELSESLEQQTATSEVLGVISRSAGDLEPVFQSMLENATRICGAQFGLMNLREGDNFRTVAFHNVPPEFLSARKDSFRARPDSILAQMVQTRQFAHTPDLSASPLYAEGDPPTRHLVDLAGARTVVVVPMLKDNELVGTIGIYRREVLPFNDKQIALLSSFASQAVIAIENTRLLNELRQRTDDLTESLQQQTATADVLQIISSSPGDLAPVFEKMLVNATRVCSAEFGSMLLAENGSMRPAAQFNVPAEFAAARGDRVFTPHPKSALAKAISAKQVVHVADMRTTEAYLERAPASLELVELGGARTVAIVPMLRDDEVIGAITVYRNKVQLFSDKQIELLSNFAKQAVIAIENARLLKELRQRTDDLSQSLDDLRTAQDRLVQTEKLASLGQLTAGIAHEIKNPLNFVNNFAALSAELTDELNDVLKPAEIAGKLRNEVDELTRLLKDNLEKVVQHGKRADSIVKNMLLHSREGSGDHRPADINALVDESLNLAYHGARAEKPDFNVTLQRDFDPAAGTLEVFPQEITRVFLNLVSNGFYAVTKRRRENGGAAFEPTLRATTKNLGDTVEIRIRDNGTGIPPEVKERMFNPFFTTKPAGEGTGLGLSMSHDIIVKQHGGTIDVDTEPGHFTEFRIVLPRTSNFSNKN